MRTVYGFLILCCSIPWPGIQKAGAQSLTATTAARIDSLFATWNTPHTPGMVVGIVHHGKLVFEKAYGMAEVAKKEKLTTSHSFWVASVAKQFTAVSVALLAEAGKLSLEDDIRKHLPELPWLGDTVRIRHLIYHTSGLRDGFTLIGMRFSGERHYTNENVRRAIGRQRTLNFRPGDRYEYNNGGYVLLAEIVSRVSGEPFADFARKNIFQPLGMHQTHFYGKITRKIPQLARGYGIKYTQASARYRKGHFKGNTQGSSGLVTTLNDLIRWDQNFYHNQLGKARADLPGQLMTPGRLNDGTLTAYAFGLEVEAWQGVMAVTHSGSDAGYKAEVVRFPEQALTIIVLSNADNAYGLTAKQLTMGKWIAPDAFGQPTAARPAKTAEKNAGQLQAKAGFYLNPANRADLRVVSVQDSVLYAARSLTGYREPLEMTSPDTFVNRGLAERCYAFSPAEETGLPLLYYQTRAEGYTLQKINPATLSQQALKAYTGVYESPELGRKYHLRLHKGKLSLRIFHLFYLPFRAMEGHRFLADLMGNNTLDFQLDASGKATGFQFSRQGVHRLYFQKIN